MDESVQAVARTAAQIWTLRWTQHARAALRADAERLGLDLRGARFRADMAEGRLAGTCGLGAFWYYPHQDAPGALFLVRHCPICRRPFPTPILVPADLAAWQRAPQPECLPERWTVQAWRHAWYARLTAWRERRATRR